MDQPQSTGSEQYGETAPPPMAAAPPPARKTDVSKPGLVIAVIALALALIGMVAFPGPAGEEGPLGEAGPQGPTGDDGDDGSDGSQGPTGSQGLSGADGVACWDLNGNGTGDIPDEDLNGDLVVDVLDCTGPQGPQGLQGPQGIQGLQGDPGLQGPAGPGTLMASNSRFSTLDFPACAPYSGSEVSITVPGQGVIVVTAMVMIRIPHTPGAEDIAQLVINENPSVCPNDDYTSFVNVISNQPAGSYIRNTLVQYVASVSGAGNYTYHLNVDQWFGADPRVERASLVAVFYPS